MVLSPVARAAWTNFGESMSDPAGATTKNARGIAFVTIVYPAVTLATMPWPARDYGRELFRSYGV